MASKIKIKANNNLRIITRTKPVRRRLPDGRYVMTVVGAPDGPTASLVVWPKGEKLRRKD